jgi:hypothetical protein
MKHSNFKPLNQQSGIDCIAVVVDMILKIVVSGEIVDGCRGSVQVYSELTAGLGAEQIQPFSACNKLDLSTTVPINSHHDPSSRLLPEQAQYARFICPSSGSSESSALFSIVTSNDSLDSLHIAMPRETDTSSKAFVFQTSYSSQ